MQETRGHVNRKQSDVIRSFFCAFNYILTRFARVCVRNCGHYTVICVTIVVFSGSLSEDTVKHVRYTHQCLGFVTVPVQLVSHNVS